MPHAGRRRPAGPTVARLWRTLFAISHRVTIPHWHEHSHAMEIFRHAELGSIRWLWVICTNPAVSLPELRSLAERRAMQHDRQMLVAVCRVIAGVAVHFHHLLSMYGC